MENSKVQDLVAAVILAGGKGTRSALTDIPKCLVEVGGVTLLEWQIKALNRANVKEIIVSTGYLASQVDAWVESYNITNFDTIRTVLDTSLNGTAFALSEISQQLTKPCVVIISGDIFLNLKFEEILSKVNFDLVSVVPLTHPNLHPKSSDIVVRRGNKHIFIPKNQPLDLAVRNNALSGIVFARVDFVRETQLLDGDYEAALIANAEQSNQLSFITTFEYVADTGTPQRLEKVLKDFKNGSVARRNARPASILLIDLDGTLIQDSGVDRYRSPKFFDDASDFLTTCNQLGIHVHVVTNQPSIAKGYISEIEFDLFISRLETIAAESGFFWDSFNFCPHHPEAGFEGEVSSLKIGCNCRKPGVGLCDLVMSKYETAPNLLAMIGDTERDQIFSERVSTPFLHINRSESTCSIDRKHICLRGLHLAKEWLLDNYQDSAED